MLKNMVMCHEHLKLDLATIERPDRKLDCFDEISQELIKLKSLGVSKIMEVSNLGMGRNIEFIERLEAVSGIEIWMSTGFYKEPYLPDYFYHINDDDLIQIICDEITLGMADKRNNLGEIIGARSHHRPKIIGEFGTSLNKISKAELRVFHICCEAHLQTGLPLITHTTLATMALEQIALFKQHNINLSSCILSHIDLSKDINDILKILESGINIGFDTVGKENYQLDQVRLDYLETIIKYGFDDQIMLSCDITNNGQLKSAGGTGYTYLIENFLPKVAERFGEAITQKLMVDNPQRIFNFSSFTDEA